jgi:hypothetical protein
VARDARSDRDFVEVEVTLKDTFVVAIKYPARQYPSTKVTRSVADRSLSADRPSIAE